MRGTIICGAIFGVVRLNLDFENKAARDWNSVDFTSPRSRIKQESKISVKFDKLGLLSFVSFFESKLDSQVLVANVSIDI